MPRLAAVLALIVLALAVAPLPDGVEGAQGGARLSGPVTVIDGDTIEVAGARIRIHGIDSPERAGTCRDRDGSPWRCGDWATAEMRGLAEGRRVDCTDLGERTHGRVVARCTLDGQDLAALAIGRGLARACPRHARNHPHSRGYEAAERAAIRAGTGIFRGGVPEPAGFCLPREAAQTAPKIRAAPASGECTIKGNINRSGERIHHLPGQAHYDRTRIDTRSGERWFCSEAEARAAGWRRARR